MEDRPRAPQQLTMPVGEWERRQGFYFCNSLIQLMENVYLDLDLGNEHFHPDNRGWMNLFRHWSWSGMFKATWAICASTYGSRFQSFCEERLDLHLGTVAADQLELSTEGYWIRPQEFPAKITKKPQRQWLNFFEQQMIQKFLEECNLVDRIYSVQVAVKTTSSDRPEDQLRFGCGFALVSGRVLVFFRIQDHLRRMGLARKALRELIRGWPEEEDRPGNPGVRNFNLAKIPPDFREEFSRGVRRFNELFHSVRREIVREEQLQEMKEKKRVKVEKSGQIEKT